MVRDYEFLKPRGLQQTVARQVEEELSKVALKLSALEDFKRALKDIRNGFMKELYFASIKEADADIAQGIL